VFEVDGGIRRGSPRRDRTGVPDNPDTWESLVDPVFADPDPDSADTFLATQLSAEDQDELIRMLAE
jgi:hypothetical protein